MFCNKCGNENVSGASFCQRCGAALATLIQPETASPGKRTRKFSLLWVLLVFPVAGVVLALLSPLLFHDEKTDQALSTALRPDTQPPKFKVFRQERGLPVPVIVAADVTDGQLRSLLWLFRENVRERNFSQLGLKKATGPDDTGFALGIINVFRDVKYASEPFTRKEGERTHAGGWN
jgi:hypothetical protein